MRMAAESPTPIIFISIMLSVAKMANTDTITAAALVTTPAVSRDAALDGEPRGQAAADELADPAEHEHVVVHRQPDEDHHHEERDPVDDEARRREVEQARPTVLEDQRQHAERDPDRREVEHRRSRDRHAPERAPIISRVSTRTKPMMRGIRSPCRSGVEGLGSSTADGVLPLRRGRRAPGTRSLRSARSRPVDRGSDSS